MQPTGGGGGGGGGLSRFRSAPATWLEALLESEEEEEEDVIIDPPKPTSANYVDPDLFVLPSAIGLGRQNSSPAEFISHINNPHVYMDTYLSSSFHSLKSSRDVPLEDPHPKFTTQLSGDQSSLLDVEMDKRVGNSVPCRVRAKRGCATHPRSIAERVRRTRISDRIRKLQDLVPNMDKQTNTADMLEEAVEYVKFLQQHIQELREHRDKCTCLAND